MGYAGHFLAVKIEDDWEEAVPLTQLQSKERIEIVRRATTHTKKFLTTKGEHVMTDDFFVSAQTNIIEFDIEQLTKEKKKVSRRWRWTRRPELCWRRGALPSKPPHSTP